MVTSETIIFIIPIIDKYLDPLQMIKFIDSFDHEDLLTIRNALSKYNYKYMDLYDLTIIDLKAADIISKFRKSDDNQKEALLINLTTLSKETKKILLRLYQLHANELKYTMIRNNDLAKDILHNIIKPDFAIIPELINAGLSYNFANDRDLLNKIIKVGDKRLAPVLIEKLIAKGFPVTFELILFAIQRRYTQLAQSLIKMADSRNKPIDKDIYNLHLLNTNKLLEIAIFEKSPKYVIDFLLMHNVPKVQRGYGDRNLLVHITYLYGTEYIEKCLEH